MGFFSDLFSGDTGNYKRILCEYFPADKNAKEEFDGRFEVEIVGRFDDSLTYGGERGIYIIKDKQNKIEYVGISGIGISERGSHTKQVGKMRQTVEDER